jgi:hypothetical protein
MKTPLRNESYGYQEDVIFEEAMSISQRPTRGNGGVLFAEIRISGPYSPFAVALEYVMIIESLKSV